MKWALVTFDKETSPEQRQALGEILGHVFPVKWETFNTGEGAIDWTADKDHAHAALNGGKTAEVKLTRFQGMTDDSAVLKCALLGNSAQRWFRYDAERRRSLP